MDFAERDDNTYRYLSQSQIDHIKEVLEGMGENPENFTELLTLVDHYVRANGKADGEYEALFTLLTTLDVMQSSQMEYSQAVRSTYPILTAISYYDFLITTGVLSSEDIRHFRDTAFVNGGRNGTPVA